MKKNYIVGVLIALIAAAGLWYWASPRYTLHEMRAAAEAGDTDELAEYIDFPALRASVKEEMKARAAAEMAKPENRGAAAFGAVLAMQMVDGMVDGMITPTAMRKVFVVDKDRGATGVMKVDATQSDMIIDRDGLDRFRLHSSKDANAGLIFTRHGLGWRLSAIRTPDVT